MYRTIKLGKIATSRTELIDITKAWLAVSVAFALVFSGANLFNGSFSRIFSFSFLVTIAIALGTAGVGFLLHELAHKFAAQHYGCTAEFRAFDQMLYIAIGLAAVIGFIFVAPGAVMILGQVTRKENGIISAVGPLTNYVLALLFLGLIGVVPAFSRVWATGFHINIWLGLFNLIPVWNLDGKKIFTWSPLVWGGMVFFGIFFRFLLPFF